MPVSYETGTASGPADLIAKLETFAATLGWTAQAATVGKVISKGSAFFGYNWDASNIWFAGAVAYNAGAAWNNQTGKSFYQAKTNWLTGPYQAYHFFGDVSPDYIHVVIEVSSGIFRHFHFGTLDKSGAYTGGQYFSGTEHPFDGALSYSLPNHVANPYIAWPLDCYSLYSTGRSMVRADIDGYTNRWHRFFDSESYINNHPDYGEAIGLTRNGAFNGSLMLSAPSAFNQMTPLFPAPIMVARPSSLLSIIGYVRDIRLARIDNFAPGDVLTIGSDQWMIFPVIQKTNTWGNTTDPVLKLIQSSGRWALAYRRA